MDTSWDKKRIYNAVEAMNMMQAMTDGAWKGRVDPDERAALKRVVKGKGRKSDFETLEEFGLFPKNKPWEG